MKIDVIGSGAIFTKYNSASYLIDDKILFDIPNGTCKKLMSMKKDIHEIRNVIITHFHADHYFDFPFLYLNQMSDCSHIEGKKSNLGIDNLQELLNKNSNLKIFTSHMNDDVREYLNKEKIDRIRPLNDFEEINL